MLALAATAGACAEKTVPLPDVSVPKYPDFVRPDVPKALANLPSAAAGQDRGWRFLQAGDLRNAEREFQLALKSTSGFYPAGASLGYLALARRDGATALARFDDVLGSNGRYVPALVGRGQALLVLNREADALFAFESAAAVDPSLADVRRRVEVLKFRGLGQDLAAARKAAASDKLDEAALAYASAIASSPDSAFLYRELAGVERRQGRADAALADLRRAMALDPTDASVLVQTGDLLDARGELEAAAKAYGDSLALEPNDAVDAKLDGVRARIEIARLPAEYRAIDAALQITRADLAALIAIRLAPLVQAARRRDPVVVTDARNHWATTWIMAVVRAGIIDPYDNHTFQPRAVVRRTDLAQAVSRLLARVAATNPVQARSWESARLKFSDLAAGHLAYPAASIAVAAGIMTTGPDNAFQPSQAVSGAEAAAAVSRIDALAGGLDQKK